MLLRVLILLLSLISTTYPMDPEDVAERQQHHLKPDTFVYNPDFFERQLDGRITLSRIVAIQRMVNDEYPMVPPNSPVLPFVRSNTCLGAFFDVIPMLLRFTIRVLTALK